MSFEGMASKGDNPSSQAWKQHVTPYFNYPSILLTKTNIIWIYHPQYTL